MIDYIVPILLLLASVLAAVIGALSAAVIVNNFDKNQNNVIETPDNTQTPQNNVTINVEEKTESVSEL